MSILIGICAPNYCALLADRRKCEFDQKTQKMIPVSDESHKIFQINSHLLFGGTGETGKFEEWCDPFTNITDLNTLDIDSAFEVVRKHIESHPSTYVYPRKYVLCGTDANGIFKMYKLVTHRDAEDPRYGYCDGDGFDSSDEVDPCIYPAFPWVSPEKSKAMKDGIHEVIHGDMKLNDKLQRIADRMISLTKDEITVGDEIEILCIT